jgi:DNA-binding response OmpR family regulator
MGAMQSDDPPALKGVRILVVEDDPLLLLDLESVLLDAGADIAGLCASVAEALQSIKQREVDAAILDFGLGRETAAPIAECLMARGTPFCFYTGQVITDPRLAAWKDHPILHKPAPPRVIVATMARLSGG